MIAFRTNRQVNINDVELIGAQWRHRASQCQKLGKIITGLTYKLLLSFTVISDVYRSFMPNSTTFRGFAGHSNRNCIQDRAYFHGSRALTSHILAIIGPENGLLPVRYKAINRTNQCWLQSNTVSHWLGANLDSLALLYHFDLGLRRWCWTISWFLRYYSSVTLKIMGK